MRVRNYGTLPLHDVQVTDDLVSMFNGKASYSVKSISSSGFLVNLAFDGDTDQNLLSPSTKNTLIVGPDYKTINLVLRVTPAAAGPFLNSAQASGTDSLDHIVTDISQDGGNPDNTPKGPPDNNGDGDPSNNDVKTPVTFDASIFDPPFGIKTFNADGIPVLRWTMIWINETNIPALKARVSDPLSEGTTYSGNLVCKPASSLTTVEICKFELPSKMYPQGRVVWEGTLGPDLGATDAKTAKNELLISFDVIVSPSVSSVSNTANIDADMNNDGLFEPGNEIRVAKSKADWSRNGAKKLPATGFSPGIVTNISKQPEDSIYQSYASLTLEIPTINLKTEIQGIPFSNGTWDATWLGNAAGYLQGTAFPTWDGNSVITGHVYNASGLPGPFVNIGKLALGSQVIVHSYGQKYIYEVRSTRIAYPDDISILGHKDTPWITLVTCKDFDKDTYSYRYRTVVQATLIKVMPDTNP